MALSRKHYEAIANVIADEIELPKVKNGVVVDTDTEADLIKALEAKRAIIAQQLASIFAKDSPEFNRERFLQACDLT